jgi:hypothetical protein
LAVYCTSRGRFEYLKPLHDIEVQIFEERERNIGIAKPLMFFPIYLNHPYQEITDGRIEFVWNSWVKTQFAEYFMGYSHFRDAALLHECTVELNSFVGLGLADMSKPMNSISCDQNYLWIYHPDFFRFHPHEVGIEVVKFANLLQTKGSHFLQQILTENPRSSGKIPYIMTSLKKIVRRFVYGLRRDASSGNVPNAWFFDAGDQNQSEFAKLGRDGRQEETRLEQSDQVAKV